ncbi:flagellar hook-length control protein FliK [Methyloversatilis thermotolerans]|uniref:flagellar hook-length control protein FliK n=1 Tax=Methyloversatilis thermotolerans TaxID=1346290 RepID=UPI0003759944|nr:flagellar hook-length control protein FliK [Methyloversatilis thermotolerans]
MNTPLPGLAQRLAALSRESVQATPAVTSLSELLPEFEAGQRYSARILQSLGDGLMRAEIAGQTVTVRLARNLQEGQTVTLTHVGRSAQTLIATLEGDDAPQAGEMPEGADNVRLSAPARTITQLLEGPAPPPPRLAGGRPLIDMPPQISGAEDTPGLPATPQIAARLAQAVEQSGLFYESHQAQWITGQRSLESTRHEPQRTFDPQPQAANDGNDARALSDRAAFPLLQSAEPTDPSTSEANAIPAPARAVLSDARAAPQEGAPIESTVPGELRPLVQNQLLGLSQPTLSWQGLAWPGQPMQLEIDDPDPDGRASTGEDADPASELPWTSRVRMVLPGLGEVQTTLTLWKDHALTLGISADDAARVRMGSSLIELQQRMSEAGFRLGSVSFSGTGDEDAEPAHGDAA